MESMDQENNSYFDEDLGRRMLHAFHIFRKANLFCDVILKIHSYEVHAHACVLAAGSQYFHTFLKQPLPRQYSQIFPQVIEIQIEDYENVQYEQAVHSVIDFMYTGKLVTCNSLKQTIVPKIREISRIMQLDDLVKYCNDLILRGDGLSQNIVVPVVKQSTINKLVAKCNYSGNILDKGSDRSGSGCYSAGLPMEHSGKVKRTVQQASIGIQVGLQLGVDFKSEITESKMGQSNTIKHQDGSYNNNTRVHVLLDDNYGSSTEEEDTVSDNHQDATRIVSVLDEHMSDDNDRDYNPHRKTAMFTAKPVKKTRRHKSTNGAIPPSSKKKKSKTKNATNPTGSLPLLSCDECDFTTERNRVLTKHKESHLAEKNICRFCDLQLATPQEWSDHLKTHGGTHPYLCTFCEKTFKCRTLQQTHRVKHLPVKPFVCEECGAGFKWKVGLTSHMIVHSKVKSFVCEICGYATAHKSQINAHRRIHTGETYRCQVEGCSYEATKRQKLKYHMVSHSPARPHQCNICGKGFSLSRGLRRHMMLHDPYAEKLTCDMCTFSTTRSDKLKEHKRKAHNMGSAPQRRLTVKEQRALYAQPADVPDDSLTISPSMDTESSATAIATPTTVPTNLIQPPPITAPLNMTWQNQHPQQPVSPSVVPAQQTVSPSVVPAQQNVFPQQLSYGGMLHSLYYQ